RVPLFCHGFRYRPTCIFVGDRVLLRDLVAEIAWDIGCTTVSKECVCVVGLGGCVRYVVGRNHRGALVRPRSVARGPSCRIREVLHESDCAPIETHLPALKGNGSELNGAGILTKTVSPRRRV